MSDAIARRVLVHGRVQGVFFRDATRHKAQARRLGGWVRNCPDGTVEALFEGPAGDVLALVQWCRGGPPHAIVTRVDVTEEPVQGLDRFGVR